MFDIPVGGLTDKDIVERYAYADVYCFGIIAWLILSQTDDIWTEKPQSLDGKCIDDYLSKAEFQKNRPFLTFFTW